MPIASPAHESVVIQNDTAACLCLKSVRLFKMLHLLTVTPEALTMYVLGVGKERIVFLHLCRVYILLSAVLTRRRLWTGIESDKIISKADMVLSSR